jgi:hypothetical protein
MWAWQSLDRETRVWYEPYTSTIAEGWVSDAVAPTLFFGVAKLHKTEEDAAERVAAFYREFLRIRQICRQCNKNDLPLNQETQLCVRCLIDNEQAAKKGA